MIDVYTRTPERRGGADPPVVIFIWTGVERQPNTRSPPPFAHSFTESPSQFATAQINSAADPHAGGAPVQCLTQRHNLSVEKRLVGRPHGSTAHLQVDRCLVHRHELAQIEHLRASQGRLEGRERVRQWRPPHVRTVSSKVSWFTRSLLGMKSEKSVDHLSRAAPISGRLLSPTARPSLRNPICKSARRVATCPSALS